jgi:hypothetical protein
MHYLLCPTCNLQAYPCGCSARNSHPMPSPCVNCRDKARLAEGEYDRSMRIAETLYKHFQAHLEELDTHTIAAVCGVFSDANDYTQRMFLEGVRIVVSSYLLEVKDHG